MSLAKKLKNLEIEISCNTYDFAYDLLIKGTLGGSPKRNHEYWNNLTNSEKMDLTLNSIILETIYGLGYIGLATKIFSPEGIIAQLFGQTANNLSYLSLAGYGVMNFSSVIGRMYWIKETGEPIGSLKWEFVDEIGKHIFDGLKFYKEEIKKII